MNWIKTIKFFPYRLFNQANEKPTVIEALIAEETIKTIQIIYKDQTVWLQRSLVKYIQHEENKVTVTIPLWLFVRKFPKLKQ